MKSKTLIELLQKADPTGDMEVTVAKKDILFTEVKEAYWDGCAHIMFRHPDGGYPTGAKIISDGHTIELHTINAYDCIEDNPEFPVEYDSEYVRNHHEKRIESARQKSKDINEEIEKEYFLKWASTKNLTPVQGENLYTEWNIKPTDPMEPLTGNDLIGHSYVTDRTHQWDVKLVHEGLDKE